MNILIDMNLSPAWVPVFIRAGWNAVHWSTVGSPSAADSELMDWANQNLHIVFAHDLDFGQSLAMTRAQGPSVIQIRAEDQFPDAIEAVVVEAIRSNETSLLNGALLTIEPHRSRLRILPFR